MGIDLQVMASYFREKGGELLPTATLRFERDPKLFSRLGRESVPCLAHLLPKGLKVGCYEDNGLRYTDVDRRGSPLTFTTPNELRNGKLAAEEATFPWNRAVLSFLLALPGDTMLVLFWC
jgi:hypothetical protein